MVELRLKEILRSRRISQVQLARQLGVTAITVNSWVTGRHYPSIEILDRIATMLNVPFVDFFVHQPTGQLVTFTARIGDKTIELTPELLQTLATLQTTNQ